MSIRPKATVEMRASKRLSNRLKPKMHAHAVGLVTDLAAVPPQHSPIVPY
jgi:hypothetical protein